MRIYPRGGLALQDVYEWAAAMSQKRSLSTAKITNFMRPCGSRELERSEEAVASPPPPKRSSHRDTFDPRWNDEFPWVIYTPDQDCRLCRKHNESSKRMVWLSVPCKLFHKDKLREHKRSRSHADAVQRKLIKYSWNTLFEIDSAGNTAIASDFLVHALKKERLVEEHGRYCPWNENAEFWRRKTPIMRVSPNYSDGACWFEVAKQRPSSAFSAWDEEWFLVHNPLHACELLLPNSCVNCCDCEAWVCRMGVSNVIVSLLRFIMI